MPISREAVQHIARLAQLELDETEIERMVRDMGAILDYVNRLQTGTLPEGTPGESGPSPEGVLRPDEVRPGLAPGEATGRAPGARGDLFRVPPAFGGE